MTAKTKMAWSFSIQTAVILAVAWLIITMTNDVYRMYKDFVPADHWMSVRKIEVRDAAVGEDPIILATRNIKEDFIAEWTAEIRNEYNIPVAQCYGQGRNGYAATDGYETLEEQLFYWWLNLQHTCKLAPGKYSVLTTWAIQPEGYPTKYVRAASNLFTIKGE